MDAMQFFTGYLMQLRMILDNWNIPFLGCSYWDFLIGVAIASVVITVLISAVRIGTVTYSESRGGTGVKGAQRQLERMRAKDNRGKPDYSKYNWW